MVISVKVIPNYQNLITININRNGNITLVGWNGSNVRLERLQFHGEKREYSLSRDESKAIQHRLK